MSLGLSASETYSKIYNQSNMQLIAYILLWILLPVFMMWAHIVFGILAVVAIMRSL